MTTSTPIVFDTDPGRYRHWRLEVEPPRATLTLAVTPDAGLRDDYELKQNSYDLSVDIELHDAMQRLRFEHPEVRVVVVTGGLDKVFCAGANIQMLAGSSHGHKVGFCKFTNETRNAIEDATAHSGQTWLAALNGTAAGGGYELALACDEILLVDDRASAVSLPEVPLLGVLPGTGGLTRVVDKRHVRRDRADLFSTRAEGVKGVQAVEWGLVDAVAPREPVRRAGGRAGRGPGRQLRPAGHGARHRPAAARAGQRRPTVSATTTSRSASTASSAWPTSPCAAPPRPSRPPPTSCWPPGPRPGCWPPPASSTTPCCACASTSPSWAPGRSRPGATPKPCWPPRSCWPTTPTTGPCGRCACSGPGCCAGSTCRPARWWPWSCRAAAAVGTLAELVLAADRSFLLDGTMEGDDRPAPHLRLTEANDGWYPMSNGLSRLQSRFWGRDDELAAARAQVGKDLLAADAEAVGLVTATPDDLDWDDEVRLAFEERNSFSPDALTGLEANLRFVGPETMETKIFARLTAWQNWIFQRPNAVGPDGALRRFGTGSRPDYDRARV